MLRRLLAVVLLIGIGVLAVQRIGSRPLPHLEDADESLPVGVYHLHSAASHDSDVPLESIAEAAGKIGLDFVIVTDHNAQMAGPVVIGGVTILSYAELSTAYGHLVQLGADDLPAPEQRKGRYILQTVSAGGGFPVIAHPSDPKRPWTGTIDRAGGIEIANTASSARQHAGPLFLGLLPAVLAWRLAPRLALAQLYDSDSKALRRWDDEPTASLVGLCGTDAHGWIDLALNLSTWDLVLLRPLPAEPEERPAAILDAIRQGLFHCVAGLLAHNPRFRFNAVTLGGVLREPGETVALDRTEALLVRGPVLRGAVAQLVLLRNGQAVASTFEPTLLYDEPGPGTYRVEVRVRLPHILFGDRLVPVIYSNRIAVVEGSPLMQPPVGPDMRAPATEPGALQHRNGTQDAPAGE